MEEKQYSEKIFNQMHELDLEIKEIEKQIENKKDKQNTLNIINKLYRPQSIKEIIDIEENKIKEQINNIEYIKKIKTIALKLNNQEFEQLKEVNKQLEEIINKLTIEINELEEQEKKIISKKQKYEILEYIYSIGIPIDEENIIDKIIQKCKQKNIDAKEILELIIEENIKIYTYKRKKEKQLTKEKMTKLGIDEDDQITIIEIKKTLSENQNIKEQDSILEYLEKIEIDEIIKFIEENITFKKTLILGIAKSILNKINEKENINIYLNILNIIYALSKEKEKEEIKTEQTKLIFLTKPTNSDLYIYDEIEKIEDKVYKKILEKEFKSLINGNTNGKSLTGLPENLFEKKQSKVRITYKILSNNYILVLNCYIKGDKNSQNIRELIEKNNIATQIHLYDSLSKNKEQINLASIKNTNKTELGGYINNFNNYERINIINEFNEEEKNAKRNRLTN